MINVSLQSSVELQKRRSKISLILRLTVFLGVTFTYFMLYNSTKYDKTNVAINSNYGRKLLSVIPTDESQLFSISRKRNLTRNLLFKEIFTNQQINFYNNYGYFNAKRINLNETNCTQPAINEFPNDGLTRNQRKNGWIVIHVILACYCFWMMAIVCDDYFIPSIAMLCKNSKIKKDVVGATFMAAASSSSELFINCVGTFVTKGDIGIGAILGSSVFNILAVPACCGLFSRQLIDLEWWPVSRDCLMYSITVLGLIGTLHDGKVMWYEGLLLVIAYFIYIFAMYCSDYMSRNGQNLLSKFRRKSRIRPYREVNEITPLLTNGLSAKSILIMEPILEVPELDKSMDDINADRESISSNRSDSYDYAYDPWTHNNNNNSMFLYILRWPMTFLFWITIPDCRKHHKLRILTFILAVCWIGILSYLVAFLITLIGDTLNIPDSVMGLTILAAGMSIPEAVSTVIVTMQGYGSMGICNSIGSNIFDILLCLGLPWFIKAYWLPAVPNENWIILNSTGLQYSTISILISLFGLYIALMVNRFRLDWKIGIACSIMYIGFLILATMIELNFFFDVNLPVCDH